MVGQRFWNIPAYCSNLRQAPNINFNSTNWQMDRESGDRLVARKMWPRCIFCDVFDTKTVLSGDGANVVICRRCGHCYSTFQSHPDYADYFGDDVPKSSYEQQRIHWGIARYHVHDTLLNFLAARGKSVLDVGCGLGYFVKRACEWGAVAQGCELSAAAVRYAHDVLKLTTVHHGRVESLGFKPSSFDIITLWDIIEHLIDPVEILICVRELLREGGTLFIQTPNV